MSAIGICAALLGGVSVVLVVHKRYEDGFVGRLFLGGIILAAVIIVVGELSGDSSYTAPLEVKLLAFSVVGFFFRHLWRFFRWARKGLGEWRAKVSEIVRGHVYPIERRHHQRRLSKSPGET